MGDKKKYSWYDQKYPSWYPHKIPRWDHGLFKTPRKEDNKGITIKAYKLLYDKLKELVMTEKKKEIRTAKRLFLEFGKRIDYDFKNFVIANNGLTDGYVDKWVKKYYKWRWWYALRPFYKGVDSFKKNNLKRKAQNLMETARKIAYEEKNRNRKINDLVYKAEKISQKAKKIPYIDTWMCMENVDPKTIWKHKPKNRNIQELAQANGFNWENNIKFYLDALKLFTDYRSKSDLKRVVNPSNFIRAKLTDLYIKEHIFPTKKGTMENQLKAYKLMCYSTMMGNKKIQNKKRVYQRKIEKGLQNIVQ